MHRLATVHAHDNQPTTNDVTTQPISISTSFTKVKWGAYKWITSERSPLAHAYHVWSTSITAIMSYPAHRQDDRTNNNIAPPTLAELLHSGILHAANLQLVGRQCSIFRRVMVPASHQGTTSARWHSHALWTHLTRDVSDHHWDDHTAHADDPCCRLYGTILPVSRLSNRSAPYNFSLAPTIIKNDSWLRTRMLLSKVQDKTAQ